MPEYSALGEKVFRLSAEYVYAMSRTLAIGDEIPIGVNPYDTTGFHKHVFSGSDYRPESSFPVAPAALASKTIPPAEPPAEPPAIPGGDVS